MVKGRQNKLNRDNNSLENQNNEALKDKEEIDDVEEVNDPDQNGVISEESTPNSNLPEDSLKPSDSK